MGAHEMAPEIVLRDGTLRDDGVPRGQNPDVVQCHQLRVEGKRMYLMYQMIPSSSETHIDEVISEEHVNNIHNVSAGEQGICIRGVMIILFVHE